MLVLSHCMSCGTTCVQPHVQIYKKGEKERKRVLFHKSGTTWKRSYCSHLLDVPTVGTAQISLLPARLQDPFMSVFWRCFFAATRLNEVCTWPHIPAHSPAFARAPAVSRCLTEKEPRAPDVGVRAVLFPLSYPSFLDWDGGFEGQANAADVLQQKPPNCEISPDL